MNRINQIPWFWATMLLSGTVLATETWLVHREYKRAGLAIAELGRERNEGARLSRLPVSLNDEDERAIEHDLSKAEGILQDLRTRRLETVDRLCAAGAPETSIDAYLDIATFVEKARELAERAGVAIRPDERFGFATYAGEGPAPELIAGVFRQRAALQYLVEKLIESRPQALLMVQREQPRILGPGISRHSLAKASKTGGQNRQGSQPGDIFAIETDRSLRMSGLVDTEAFRLEFSGPTRAVRSFLNSLVGDDVPISIFVRSVEIGLAAASTLRPDSRPVAPTGAPAPESLARFVVVVEYVESITTPAKPVL